MGIEFDLESFLNPETPGGSVEEDREEEQQRLQQQQQQVIQESPKPAPISQQQQSEPAQTAPEPVGLKWEMTDDELFSPEMNWIDSYEEVDRKRAMEEQARIDKKRPETLLERFGSGLARAYYEAQSGVEAFSTFVGDLPSKATLDLYHATGAITDEDYQEAISNPDEYREKFNMVADKIPGLGGMLVKAASTTPAERQGLQRARQYWIEKAKEYPVSQKLEDLERSEAWDEFLSPSWYVERLGPEAVKMGISFATVAGGPVYPLLIISGSNFGSTYEQTNEMLKEKRPDLETQEREYLSGGISTAVAFAEYAAGKLLGIPEVAKAILGNKAAQMGYKTGVMNRMSRYLFETRAGRQIQKAATIGEGALDNFFGLAGRQAARQAGQVALAMGAEGTEEVVSGEIQRFINYMVGDEDAYEDHAKSIFSEFIGGAAIAAPIATAGFVTTGPEHRQERRQIMSEEANKLASTPEGIAALNKLSKIENPSRKDYINAGFDPGKIGNAEERQSLAQLFTDEAIERANEAARRQKDLDAGLERGKQDAAAIQQQVEQAKQVEMVDYMGQQIPAADVEASQVRQRAAVAKQIAQQEAGQIAGPEYIKKMTAEKQRLSEGVQRAFEIEKPMADAVADVMQNNLTMEEVSAITFTRGGQPTETALYQIQEAVKEIVGQTGGKTEGNESRFFGRGGLFMSAAKKAVRGKDLRRGRTLVPGDVAQQWREEVQKARQAIKEAQDRLYRTAEETGQPVREILSKKVPDPSPAGRAFDALYRQEDARPILEEAARDLEKFTAENPQFEGYYETETEGERQALAQKYPEMKQDYNFWFYRMINAIASAETELSQNTEETDAAYGGVRQTGRIPVVMGERQVRTPAGNVQTKPDPIYSLPRGEDAQHPFVTEEDLNRVTNAVAEVANRVGKRTGKIIPRREINILLDPLVEKIPKGFKMKGPTQKKRGKDATSYKDWLYEYFAPTHITGADTKAVGTTSKPLVAKLLREYITDGEAKFKDRVRTAFTIYGGSSQYNKSRNYATINKLLDSDTPGIPSFKNEDGTPDIPKLIDWLNERVSWKVINKEKQALGFGPIAGTDKKAIIDTVWTAEGTETTVPRTFMFGPKVGAYMLNRMADYDPRNADYNTMDVWESRFWRALVPDIADDAQGIAEGLPRKIYMRLARDFPKVYKEMTGKDMKVSAGQAARWYLMKTAAAKAGYAKAGESETIAGFTQRIMDRWINWQLGAGRPEVSQETTLDTPEVRDVLLDEEFGVPPDYGIETMTVDVTPPEAVEIADTGTIPSVISQLFQVTGNRIVGAMEQLPGGDIILRGFHGSDVDTALEEVGHGLRRLVLRWDIDAEQRGGISDQELQSVEDWAHGGRQKLLGTEVAARRENWSRNAEERFARAFRKWIQEGNAPTSTLGKAFRVLSNALTEIYNRVVSRDPAIEVTPELRNVFEKMSRRRQTLLERQAARQRISPSGESVLISETADRQTNIVRDAGPDEFLAAQEGMEQPEFMDKKSSEYVQDVITRGGTVRLSSDGKAGYLITPEGDLQNLFVNKTKGKVVVTGKQMMAQAIADGARTLDCYRGHLTDFYSNMGWKVKSFSPWNDEYAPANWDYEKFGTPDYVEMVYDGARDPKTVLDAYKTHGDPQAQFQTGNPVFDALDEYEFEGGQMNIDTFIEENGLELSPQQVIEQLEDYDRYGEAYFDPETGDIYFMPKGDTNVIQVEEETNIRPENAAQYQAGGPATQAAGYGQRTLARGRAVRRGRPAPAPSTAPDAGELGGINLAGATGAEQPSTARRRTEGKKYFEPEVSQQLTGGESANPRVLTQRMAERFGVTVHPGRLSVQNAFAYYHTGNKTIRADQREIFNLGIMSHEVAHKIDDQYGFTKMDLPAKVEAQLKQLDYSNSDNIVEGFAEFIRILFTRNHPDKWNTDAVHEWFENTLRSDDRYADLLNKITQTREELSAWRNKGAIERVSDIFAGDKETDFESVYGKTTRDGTDVIVSRKVRDAISEWLLDDDHPLHRLTDLARENFKDMLRGGDPTLTEEQLQDRWLELRRSMGHDPGTLHMLLRGTQSQLAERALRNGVFSVRTGKQLSDITMQDVFGEIEPEERSEFSAYAFAKAAIERMDLNEGYEPGVDRDTLETVVREIEASDKGQRYLGAARMMTQYHNSILDLMIDAGIHTPAEAEAAKSKYEFYVPMQRVKPGGKVGWGTGSSFIGVGKMMNKLKGGSMRPVMDPLDSIVRRTASAYQLANAKMVESSIIGLYKNVPGLGSMIEKVEPEWRPNEASLIDMLTQLEESGAVDTKLARTIRDVYNIEKGKWTEATLKRVARELGVPPEPDGSYEPNDLLVAAREAGIPDANQVITTWAPLYRGSNEERIISTIAPNGKRELYQVSPDIWGMYNNYGSAGGNYLTQLVQDFSRATSETFKAGATGYSLAFSSVNFVRDSLFYMVKPQVDSYGEIIPLSEKTAGLGKNIYYASQQALSRIIDARSNNNVTEFKPTSSDVGNLYLTLGGQFHTKLGDLLVSGRDVGTRFLGSKDPDLSAFRKITGKAAEGLGVLKDVVAATELPARMAAFEINLRRNEKAGGYKILPGGKIEGQVPMWAALEALHSAAEATVNFKVGGRFPRTVEMYFPYTKAAWNANRSLIEMAKIMRDNPSARTQFALAFGTYLGSVVLMETISQLAGWDDEEERNRWEQEGYVNFGPVRAPKIREMAFLTEPVRIAVRNAIRMTKGKDTDVSRALGENIANQLKEHLPIPGVTHRSGFWGALISAGLNWDNFRNKPIESPWLQKMAVADRTDKQVWTGSAGAAALWNAVTPEGMNVSPKKIDYILKNTLAGHQRYINLMDTDSNKSLGRRVVEASPVAHFVTMERLGQTWYDMREEKDKLQQKIEGLRNQKYIHPEKEKAIEEEIKATEEQLVRHKYAEGLIREMQAVHYGGDQRLYEYMNGIARWVMGKPELESYPNPLGMDKADLPKVITESDAWKKLRNRKGMAAK